jgi:3-oxoacyl-[acyl-carrier-protein] synthase II
MSRAVVTGTGAVSPLGRGSGEFVTRVLAGESAIKPLPEALSAGLQTMESGRFETFSPQPEIPAMKARRLDRGSQFAVIACGEALKESGFPAAEDPDSIGVALGTASAGADAVSEFLRVLITESPEAAPPFQFPNTVANAPAGQVALELKVRGPNVMITQKAPSALNALVFSILALASGRARAMLAGGVDEWNPVYAAGFDRVGALRGRRRPSGYVQGEGGFAVLLEREEQARARGARVLARVAGIGVAAAPGQPWRFVADPEPVGRAFQAALADAKASPAQIGLYLPSKNGVTEMDRAEEEAARALFGTPPPAVAVKDAIGEMAAAGAAQLVLAARAIADPTGPFNGSGRPRRALVSSCGAGGNFLAVVLEEAS